MSGKFIGEYPASWTKEFRNAFRAARGNKCERCGHPDDAANGYALTIHHLDNDKSNCADWNLAALCQRCHLHIQGKVEMRQGWMFEHSEWMKPHIEGMRLALLARAQERDKQFEQSAIEASREGDDDGVWLAMAARSENKRFMEKLTS